MATETEGSSLHPPLPHDASSRGETVPQERRLSTCNSFYDGWLHGRVWFFLCGIGGHHGHTNDVTPSVVAKWSTEWKEVNDEFEKKLLADDDLKIFSGKMFMVWDGNHRLQAWMPIIEQFHAHDINWHFCVESVILDPKGDVPSVIAALHEVNW